MGTKDRVEDWHDVLDNASLGVHLVDANGKILWANKLELELLGYTREEYINRHVTDFHVDKDVIDQILCSLTGTGKLASYRRASAPRTAA